MHQVPRLIIGVASVMLLLGVGTSWGGPPNPTSSDANNNTAGGTNALLNVNGGGFNTAFGFDALYGATTGPQNTAVGVSALGNITTGRFNIALGFEAGSALTSGDNNFYLGHAGQATESGIIRLGTPGVHTETFLAGNVHATIVGPSDARLKTHITPLTHVLEKLAQLRGVSFAWNEAATPLTGHAAGQRDIGVIAQEVEALFPELVIMGPDGYKAVAYDKLTAVLIAAVQELDTTTDARLAAQQQHIGVLEARLAAIEQASRVGGAPAHLSVFSLPAGWPLWATILSLVVYTWHRRKQA